MPVIDRVGNFVTSMTRPDNMGPIIASEAMCVGGRTKMAYKRGGEQEARERVIEELCGTFTWLYGAKFLNWCGDKVLDKVLKNGGVSFDVGEDIMRRPFDNFMMTKSNYPKGFTSKQISMLKGAKVITALLLANLFVGGLVPKFNQALSRKLRAKSEEKNNQNLAQAVVVSQQSNPAFKGMSGLNAFTNVIENTNIGKLVGTEVGIVGGRVLNARRPEETLDIGIRDIGSMYFYYWARPHAANIMNLIETGGKTAHRLDPQSVNLVTAHLEEFLTMNGGKMSVEEFTQKVFGANDVKLPEGLEFEKEATTKFENFASKFGKQPSAKTEAIELEKFLEALTPEQKAKYETTARQMSELQPKRQGVSILSKNQIVDILSGGEINSPKFLHKLFDNVTDGAYKQEYKYVSHKELYKHKDMTIKYVEDIIKAAGNGNIDAKLLKSVKNKNLIYNGINFGVGFTIAVAFLSTFIPKLQYYVTQKVTGHTGFPGDDDFGKQPKVKLAA